MEINYIHDSNWAQQKDPSKVYAGAIFNNGKISSCYKNLSRNSSVSINKRRDFLKMLTIIGIGIPVISCTKQTGEEPISAGLLTGPTILEIPKLGGHISGTYLYTGNIEIEQFCWKVTTPSSIGKTQVYYSSPELQFNFCLPGIHKIEVFKDQWSSDSLASLTIEIRFKNSPTEMYDLPLLLLVTENPLSNTSTPLSGIYTYNPSSGALSKIFSDGRIYNDRVNWSPLGNAFVFTHAPKERKYPETPHIVSIFNMKNGSVKPLSDNSSGLAWKATWSPKGDWIAYTDDSNAWRRSNMTGNDIRYSYDEIILIRSDGSEKFYLRGDGDKEYIMKNGPDYAALSLTWNPTGEKLVASAGFFTKRRLKIHSDLFSGNPTATFAPTDNQLKNLYYSNGLSFHLSEEDFMSSVMAGANGIAWSPDGQMIAYSLQFGFTPAFNCLVISDVHLKGEVQILVMNMGDNNVEWVDIPRSPTWSKDGKKLYFTSFAELNYDLFEIDIADKSKINKITPQNLNVRNVSLFD